MKKVKCIKTFSVEMYDDDGFAIENSDYIVPKDSIWDIQEFSLRIIDGEVRLLNNDLGWIEITTERFIKYFEII
mgnify:CR=1 FL=1